MPRDSKMKDKLSPILVFILAAFFCSTAWGQDNAAPEIFFKEKLFDAGEVVEGTVIEHTYPVYNRGNSLLKILKVSPG